jgi:TRAP-type mannitol/chloroaromatic compound transport system permease large subunit
VPHEGEEEDTAALIFKTLRALFAPVALIIAVLGSILAGIATPTEAAAVGAIGAVLLAGYRQQGASRPVVIAALSLIGVLLLTAFVDLRVARNEISTGEYAAITLAFLLCAAMAWGITISLIRLYRNDVLPSVMQSTARISSMVFVILIGAALFSLVFRGLGGDETVQSFLSFDDASLMGRLFGDMAPIIAVMAVMFILGFFLDFIEITFVVVPIVAPILLAMGFDPVWLGVMMAINLQTSFLTPPFGFALFYLRGVAPDSMRTAQIYLGVIPFVLIQIGALIIISLYPQLATWLPTIVFG